MTGILTSRQEMPREIGLKYGAIIFDGGHPGPGWGCRAGEGGAFRFESLASLGTSTLWWTNASYDDCRNAGLNVNHWMRHAGYLRTSMAQAIDEWGLANVSIDETVTRLASFFARIMNYARMATGHEISGASGLSHELSELFPDPEMPDPDVSPAVRHSIQEWTRTQVRSMRDGIEINLRRPRLTHATEILGMSIPHGPWEFVPASRLPPPDKRVRWIIDSQRPALVQLQITRSSEEASSILAFGQGARDESGAPLRRTWCAAPEFIALSQHAELDVQGVWLGGRYGKLDARLPESVRQRFASPLAGMSWSVGLFTENWWIAATRPAKPKNQWSKGSSAGPKKKPGSFEDARSASFRAAWLRAADRVNLFLAAMKLSNMNYSVISYGVGAIRISIHDTMIQELVNDSFKLGFTVPLSLTAERRQDLKAPNFATWGGRPENAIEACMRAAGHREAVLAFDGLIDCPPEVAAQVLQKAAALVMPGQPGR